MTTLQMLPMVSTCAVSGCSYNHDTDCRAGAITVTAASSSCGTFLDGGGPKGGLESAAHVGACHRTDCVHNTALECGAPDVQVGPAQDAADCLTFNARQ